MNACTLKGFNNQKSVEINTDNTKKKKQLKLLSGNLSNRTCYTNSNNEMN